MLRRGPTMELLYRSPISRRATTSTGPAAVSSPPPERGRDGRRGRSTRPKKTRPTPGSSAVGDEAELGTEVAAALKSTLAVLAAGPPGAHAAGRARPGAASAVVSRSRVAGGGRHRPALARLPVGLRPLGAARFRDGRRLRLAARTTRAAPTPDVPRRRHRGPPARPVGRNSDGVAHVLAVASPTGSASWPRGPSSSGPSCSGSRSFAVAVAQAIVHVRVRRTSSSAWSNGS